VLGSLYLAWPQSQAMIGSATSRGVYDQGVVVHGGLGVYRTWSGM
jgi:hypothetical protein